MNETAKIPAFCNMLSEANHNEIEGFDGGRKNPLAPLHVIMLRDESDHPRIGKRMRITEELYTKRQVPVTTLDLQGATPSERIFSGALIGMATALGLGKGYGNDTRTPLIELLKQRLKS